jgi:hypothetical protein
MTGLLINNSSCLHATPIYVEQEQDDDDRFLTFSQMLTYYTHSTFYSTMHSSNRTYLSAIGAVQLVFLKRIQLDSYKVSSLGEMPCHMH